MLKKYARIWGISTDHFDPYASNADVAKRRRQPLEKILVEGSTYSRNNLKKRLYLEGLKQRACELCGQGEDWRGRRMGLILDHINGVSNDNRIENLRIVCPNCAATLDTHCARSRRVSLEERPCVRCGESFLPKVSRQRYCSLACGSRWDRRGRPNPALRRVARPPYAQLKREINALGYSAVGRRYRVSDNAIRKWVRQYEREAEAAREDAA